MTRSDVDLAADLVREAGGLAARLRDQGLRTEHKSSRTDVVTQADRAAERLIVDHLAALRPDDGVVGEEGATVTSGSGRTWVIDPVDGTYDFVHELPWWCSALALCVGEDPVLGAVYDPEADRLWTGGPAFTTTRDGSAVDPIADRPLGELAVATYLHPPRFADDQIRGAWERAVGGAATVRMIGSAAMSLAAVADGRLGLWLHADVRPWDWFPGMALVRGAGGEAVQIDVDGTRWSVAGPPRAVAEVLSALEDR